MPLSQSALSTLANFLEAAGTIGAVTVALFVQVYRVKRRQPRLELEIDEKPESEDFVFIFNSSGPIVEYWIRLRVVAAPKRRTATGTQVRVERVETPAGGESNEMVIPSGPLNWSSVGSQPQSILSGMWQRVDILRYTHCLPEVSRATNIQIGYNFAIDDPQTRLAREGRYSIFMLVGADDSVTTRWRLDFNYHGPRTDGASTDEMRNVISDVRLRKVSFSHEGVNLRSSKGILSYVPQVRRAKTSKTTKSEKALKTRNFSFAIVILLVPIAFLIDYVIGLFGDTWTPADWGSNIVFALAITAATIFLGQRQQRLQQSIADAELIELTASAVGSLDRVLKECESSALHEALLAARSGLQLVPFANERGREEFYESLSSILDRVVTFLHSSTRSTTEWRNEEWAMLYRSALSLREDSKERTRSRAANVAKFENNADALLQLLDGLRSDLEERDSAAFVPLTFDACGAVADQRLDLGEEPDHRNNGSRYREIPWEAFERSFRRGDQNQRVRVRLKWSVLEGKCHDGNAQIQLRHWWSETFFENCVYSVWCVDGEGEFTRHDTKDATPILLNEIDRHYNALAEAVRETILEMSEWLGHRVNSRLPTLEIVTLQVGNRSILVLDGNHRLAALRHSRPTKPRISALVAEYRIVLKAGLDRSILSDLRHYPRSD